jgi:hypothetical protein
MNSEGNPNPESRGARLIQERSSVLKMGKVEAWPACDYGELQLLELKDHSW